jgi:hypothetical protein
MNVEVMHGIRRLSRIDRVDLSAAISCYALWDWSFQNEVNM